MDWAEARLKSLGFVLTVEGNVLSWLDDRAECVVFADPRIAGGIRFEVWPKPLPKARPTGPGSRSGLGEFTLYDTYKIDLPEKYRQRLEVACRESV